MRSRNRAFSKKKVLILSLLILLLCMSIGYADLSSSLKLNAIASVDKMTWDVHLENVVVRSGSVSTNPPTLNNEKTGVTFSVSFKQPNEYYEFYIDVVNKGTIDAQVDSFFKTTLTAEQAKFIDYKITYKDETEIKKNDILSAGEKETLKVLVYIKDLHESLYPSINATLTLEGKINYIQKNDDGVHRNKNSLYEEVRSQTQPDTNINFGAISSDTNGKGVYTLSRTVSYAYPVYYYRGDVKNNNVIFGGYCWQIIRTTTTGGIKLIYNGVPNNGACDNTGTDKEIGKSAFNIMDNDAKYVGYMYDDNTKDSTIKEFIDEWFSANLINYQDYLEDTPFYNERDYDAAVEFPFNYAPRKRIWGNSLYNYEEIVPKTTIKLGATYIEDVFTVSSDNGNGRLTYPIGLLTSDEVVMAGGRGFISDSDTGANTNYFLYTGSWYSTISSSSSFSDLNTHCIGVYYDGYIRMTMVGTLLGVRPVLSLQACTSYTSGDGTSNSPYIITK